MEDCVLKVSEFKLQLHYYIHFQINSLKKGMNSLVHWPCGYIHPDRVIPKTQKMVLDASLLNTQSYKVGINGNVEQSKERSSSLAYT